MGVMRREGLVFEKSAVVWREPVCSLLRVTTNKSLGLFVSGGEAVTGDQLGSERRGR